MNYNMLFETLYSYTITEDVKSSIVERVKDRIGDELNEGLNNGSHYVTFINTLLESDISDIALDETLDLAFSGLSEEAIDDITEEFKKTAVIKAINEWDPAPVGLSGVHREAAKQQEKASQPKAIDRLKSAVGKVKGWAKNGVEKVKAGVEKVKSAVNQPTGIDRLKQMRSEMVKHAVEMGTGPKVEKTEAPKPVVQPEVKAEDPKPEQPKVEDEHKEKKSIEGVHRLAQAQKAVEDAQKKAEIKNTSKKATKTSQASTKAKKVTTKPKSEQLKLEVEPPKVENKEKNNQTTKPEVSKQKTSKTTRKAKTSSLKKAAKKVITDAEQPKELVPAKRGRSKKTNEALEEAIKLLTYTNISEEALVEIVEMISNKKAAQKAVERDYEKFKKAVDSLNDVEVMKARTGYSPVSQEEHDKMIKKAEDLGSHYERFKSLSDKKFGE